LEEIDIEKLKEQFQNLYEKNYDFNLITIQKLKELPNLNLRQQENSNSISI
jgi:hypothetical protein